MVFLSVDSPVFDTRDACKQCFDEHRHMFVESLFWTLDYSVGSNPRSKTFRSIDGNFTNAITGLPMGSVDPRLWAALKSVSFCCQRPFTAGELRVNALSQVVEMEPLSAWLQCSFTKLHAARS